VPQCALAFEKLLLDAGAPEGVYTNVFLSNGQAAKVVADPRIKGSGLGKYWSRGGMSWRRIRSRCDRMAIGSQIDKKPLQAEQISPAIFRDKGGSCSHSNAANAANASLSTGPRRRDKTNPTAQHHSPSCRVALR